MTLQKFQKSTLQQHFNSHAHVERDKCRCHSQKCRLNFNSHAHVERDNPKGEYWNYFYISTHTLTWSVTSQLSVKMSGAVISTHTLTWSVTFDWLTNTPYGEFQLTRSRGAWLLNPIFCQLKPYFNSHAHVERDNRVIWNYLHMANFNSHAHVERDHLIG